MRFLISNDDGIYSPGLLALARAARRLGDVRLVAPDVEQSSMGHAITHSRPLTARATPIDDLPAWRVNGTPADCVTLGMELFGPVDAVLSGINLGPNLGNSSWHSGTLAAARQAALLGRPGLAFSTPVHGTPPDFARLEPWVVAVLEQALGDPAPRLLNVNLPHAPEGIRWTTLSVRHYDGHVVPGTDPYGRKHHWIVVRPLEQVEEGSDRWAMRHGLVSVTPLRLDLTDREALAAPPAWRVPADAASGSRGA